MATLSSTIKEKRLEDESTPTGTNAQGGYKGAFGQTIDALRLQIEDLQKKEESLLETCMAEIASMNAAVKKQPNVSVVVKRGLLKLEEFLLDTQGKRKTWRRMEEVLSKESTGRGRNLSSPPMMQRTPAKRNRDTVVSPEEPGKQRPAKKKKKEEEPEWQRVEKKRSVKKNRAPKPTDRISDKKAETRQNVPKVRRNAISIKPGESKSYAQILKDIKDKIVPEQIGVEIKAIRQTRDGQVLLELGNKTKDPEKLSTALIAALGDSGTVKSLVPKISLEIKDLDCLTEKIEVEEALKRDLPDAADFKVNLTKPNKREQKIAIVEMGDRAAAKLLEQGKIKIGWVLCRIRRRVVVQRCFKCLGYGHIARVCKGPDRSRLCYRCGGTEHKAKECTGPQRCVLCAERDLKGEQLNHTLGSGNCAVFRDALQKTKQTAR